MACNCGKNRPTTGRYAKQPEVKPTDKVCWWKYAHRNGEDTWVLWSANVDLSSGSCKCEKPAADPEAFVGATTTTLCQPVAS